MPGAALCPVSVQQRGCSSSETEHYPGAVAGWIAGDSIRGELWLWTEGIVRFCAHSCEMLSACIVRVI